MKQHRRWLALAPALVLVSGAGVACSSSVSGAGKQTKSASTTSSGSPSSSTPTSVAPTSSSPTAAGTSGFPTDTAALAKLIQQGTRSLKFAHLKLTEDVGTTSVAATGTEVLTNSKAVAIDLRETVTNAGVLHFRIVDGRVFAQLPAALYPAKKPWLEITANSSNATLQQLYTSFQSSLQSSASASAQLFVAAAKQVQLRGTQQLDGAQVAHYSLTIDIATLPADFPNRAALEQSGIASIPIELYVDGQGRPRKVTEDVTVASQHVTVDAELSDFDVPVSITPPPAAQIERS